MENEKVLKKDLGLLIATALVTGNMMGSGIFMLPASMAKTAGPLATILAWLLTSGGSIFLALSFAKLGSKFPKTGGPYEYSKLAFGDFTGFISAWLYWNGSWIGNAAILTAISSYAGQLLPILSSNKLIGFLFTSLVLWVFTLINIIGVKRAAKMQTIITIFELVLFTFFIVVCIFHFNSANIMPMVPNGKGLETLPKAAALTLWAFTGLESASVTAGEIKNPEKNVKRSTILGILIAAVMYFCINFFAMGAMSQNELAKSSAPIADILSKYLGSNISTLITIGAVISILGTTLGWLLATARVAFAAGEDKIFPEFFAKVHPKYKTPYVAIIIGSVLVNILLALNYTKGFMDAFNFIILLAALSFLPVYAITAAADMVLLTRYQGKITIWKFIKGALIPLIAFIYAVWTIYGSGAETVMYGFIMLLSGIPFYIYMLLKNEKKAQAIRKLSDS